MSFDVMIDIETLDTKPSSVVLSVGAVKFNPHTTTAEPHTKTLWRPDLNEQFDAYRTTSDSTIEWWGKQDNDIKERAFSDQGRVSIEEMVRDINRYMVGANNIWCHGPQFDMVIIEDLITQFGLHWNWQYWQIRDSRTLFSIMPVDPRKAIQQDLHSADDDAYWQAVCVQQTYQHFGVTQ